VFSIMVNNVAHAGLHAEIVAAVDEVAVALCAAADQAQQQGGPTAAPAAGSAAAGASTRPRL
jgi:hypothetical protein